MLTLGLLGARLTCRNIEGMSFAPSTNPDSRDSKLIGSTGSFAIPSPQSSYVPTPSAPQPKPAAIPASYL